VQALFLVFQLVLKYHHPEIWNLLIENDIPPNLYATPWFITVFASKTSDFEVLFYLWDEIIKENDRLFICYVAVAFLQNCFQELRKSPSSELPQKVSGLKIKDLHQAIEIISKSRELKHLMPICCQMKLVNYNIYSLESIDEIINTLSKEVCLSVNPRYLLQKVYGSDNMSRCKETSLFPDMDQIPFIIIDCRSLEEFNSGHLSISELVNPDGIEDIEMIKQVILDKFQGNKGNFHFCLMGSSGLKSEDNDLEYHSQVYLSKIFNCLIDADFPYVSILEGGYLKLHEFVVHYKVSIDGHVESKCFLCKNDGSVNHSIRAGLHKFKNKFMEGFKGLQSVVKSLPKVIYEEVKSVKQRGVSRKNSEG
jgi:hypothetical protein